MPEDASSPPPSFFWTSAGSTTTPCPSVAIFPGFRRFSETGRLQNPSPFLAWQDSPPSPPPVRPRPFCIMLEERKEIFEQWLQKPSFFCWTVTPGVSCSRRFFLEGNGRRCNVPLTFIGARQWHFPFPSSAYTPLLFTCRCTLTCEVNRERNSALDNPLSRPLRQENSFFFFFLFRP